MTNQKTTEQRNSQSLALDEWNSLEIVSFMNKEDETIAVSIQKALPTIALAIDAIVAKWITGGRVFVIGAGTSGRLGVVDAVELGPTFSIEKERWTSILSGGYEAMWTSLEETEDDEQHILTALRSHSFSSNDVLIGVTASGSTPFVLSAIQYAKEINATTIGISNNEHSLLSSICDYGIEAVTGPEVIRGSTRLKAGTAQKMILNMLSTASMVRLGKVYSNEMVDMRLINSKLVKRAIDSLTNLTEITELEATKILEENDYDLKTALFRALTDSTKEDAFRYIAEAEGHIKKAVQLYFSKKIKN
ncbi:N-acetylmuramic acid 6-phosphate etherase [Bacillus sp. B1-b2]|uniref:N-acetylmuramic acid 6-phosphate etherase n=1 Tax=Bacillus sp. B1-b2 TaxID=2653201 RepID=UPI0012615A6E|nr:N-acetylmuramic acid 6-phosphate etherase [Bacillus sp. B1-b2]KAB7667608.1 N-acetylmuramic acid 6-phosphate etherase [Bacillus sp. B1-b2]